MWSRERLTAVFSDEVKNHIFFFALMMVVLHAYRAWNEGALEIYGDAFVLSALLFSLFFCVLEHLFKIFVKGLAPVFVSVLPALLIYFLVDDVENMPYLGAAVITAAVFRLVFGILPFSEKIVLYGSFLLAALAIWLNFGVHAFSGANKAEIYTFVCIVVLVMSAFQHIFVEKRKGIFPFAYFAIIGIIIAFIPVKDEPIDWTPVVEMGERIAQGAGNIYDSASYYFSGMFKGGNLTTGYSSLSNVGGKTSGTEKTELILTTNEKPYVIYQDKETDEYMKRRRCVYLVGGRGVDKENLVLFLQFLYSQDVTRDTAMLFSHRSEVEVEYAYLRTKDEIAPQNSIRLSSMGKDINGGKSDQVHKKGYQVRATYLDIDFGSPYLADYVRKADVEDAAKSASYEELSDYMKSIYNVDLRNIVTENEFGEILIKSSGENSAQEDALDITGCSEEMKELAESLTAGYDNDYDKARAIEEFLRQYTYSLDIPEDSYRNVDMTSAAGMSELADTFLFKTGKGYCIHYTSAMVMLLRLSGIPSRPALGFCYLYPFEEKEVYRVSGSSAHTWPEAFFSNVGWISFEPTATYPTAQSLTWNKVAKDYEKSEESSFIAGYEDWYKEYIDGESAVELTDFDEETSEDEGNTASWRILKISIAVILCVAALFGLLLLGTYAARKLRYKNGSLEQKLVMDVEQIKKMIRKYSREDFFDRGFLSDYVKRAPESLQQDVKSSFDVFYRLEYGGNGNNTVTAEDVAKAREILKMLNTKQKK